MSQFVVNLNEPEKDEPKFETPKVQAKKVSSAEPTVKKRGGCGRILGISAIVLGVILLIGAVVGYFYWQGLKTSPQYSLALLDVNSLTTAALWSMTCRVPIED